MMLNTSPVYLLISSYCLLVVGKNEKIEISQTCSPRDLNPFNRWGFSVFTEPYSTSNFSLPRPWTVNSTLTVLVQWTDTYGKLTVSLDGEYSQLTLTIMFHRINENFEYIEIIVKNNRSEELWRSEFGAVVKPNEPWTLSLTRDTHSYEVKVNDRPILLEATRRDGHEESSLQIDSSDVHNRITVETFQSLIKNVCFWNTTNILPGRILKSSYCTLQEERSFPDKINKRYIGRSLTKNTVLTIVGKWSAEDAIYIELSSNTSFPTITIVYVFGRPIHYGRVYMKDSSGNRTGPPFEFTAEVPANELYRFDIERRQTFYEITINGQKFNVSQPEYQIDLDVVHDEFQIGYGGRRIRNICVYDKGMQEDLQLELETIPFAIALSSTCHLNNTCDNCLWFAERSKMTVEKPCRNLTKYEKPYLFKLPNIEECRLIDPYTPKPIELDFEVCLNATILRTSP